MIEYLDSKRARGQAFLDTLSESEMQRYDTATQKIRLEYAKLHGDKLVELVVENSLIENAMQVDILPYIHGDDKPVNWRSVAMNIVENDEMIQRNLTHADEDAKAQIKNETLSALKPAERMAMSRAGTLDRHLNDAVRTRLDAEH